jgi:argininosuccinate lyase
MIAMNRSLQSRIREIMVTQGLDYREACEELGRHAAAARHSKRIKQERIDRERQKQERMGIA